MNKKKIIIICCFLLFFLISLISILVINTFKTIEIRDVNLTYNRDNYLKTKSYKSKLLIFPRTIDNVATINDYYYIDYQASGCSIIVLDATYDENGFSNEINRLENLIVRNWLYSEKEPSDYGQYKKLLYSNDNVLFSLPTYIAEYNCSGRFEYVCIDYNNRRCVYAFMEYMPIEKIDLDETYIPFNYGNNVYCYTIYPKFPDVTYNDWYK